jgi:hypothetical protein
MKPNQHYISLAIDINNLLYPNKLYNSRSIYKHVRDKTIKLGYNEVMKALTYAREHDIILYDKDYVSNITYWRKI